MIVHLMLCDHAQVADGKLFINGGGITRFYGAGLPPGTSIALLLLVPWERTNEKIDVQLDLLTEDGHPVTDAEGAGLGMSGQFEVGRPPGGGAGDPDRCAVGVHDRRRRAQSGPVHMAAFHRWADRAGVADRVQRGYCLRGCRASSCARLGDLRPFRTGAPCM